MLSITLCCCMVGGYIMVFVVGLHIFITIFSYTTYNPGPPPRDSDAAGIQAHNLNSLQRQSTIKKLSDKLPIVKMNTINKGLFMKSYISCPICTEEYKKGDKVILLPCDPRYLQ